MVDGTLSYKDLTAGIDMTDKILGAVSRCRCISFIYIVDWGNDE